MRALRTLLVAALVASALALVACLEPTQIELILRTDVPYAPGRTVAISVSKTGARDVSEPSTTAEDAWDASGKIGTLVLLPAERRDEAVSVQAVLGLGRDPSTCTLADAKGCIFARRRLAFLPHEPLALPVTLFAACEGVPCDESSTCTALGQCVSATLDPTACAAGQVCEPGADASGSSGGTSSLCDPTDVTLEPQDLGSGSTRDGAEMSVAATVEIIVLQPGGSGEVRTVLPTPNQGCPLHVALQVNDLVIDSVGASVVMTKIMRAGAEDLILELTHQDGNNYAIGFRGSANRYTWVGVHAGIVEVVVPLSASERQPPRIVVGGVETTFDDMPAPTSAVKEAIVDFGLSGATGRVEYQDMRYFFAP